MKQNNTPEPYLTSLEYSGLESLFQRIVAAYEDYINIPEANRTKTQNRTSRTDDGINIDSAYTIDGFVIDSLIIIGDSCAIGGYICYDIDPKIYYHIDITEFLDMKTIDIERLLDKIFPLHLITKAGLSFMQKNIS